jgi:hypothetical protein
MKTLDKLAGKFLQDARDSDLWFKLIS